MGKDVETSGAIFGEKTWQRYENRRNIMRGKLVEGKVYRGEDHVFKFTRAKAFRILCQNWIGLMPGP